MLFLGGFRKIIRVAALATVFAAVVEGVVSGVANRETQIERLEV